MYCLTQLYIVDKGLVRHYTAIPTCANTYNIASFTKMKFSNCFLSYLHFKAFLFAQGRLMFNITILVIFGLSCNLNQKTGKITPLFLLFLNKSAFTVQ